MRTARPIFAALCLLAALAWGMVFLFIVGMGHVNIATSDQRGTSDADGIVLLLPIVFALILFIASFRFIPLWLTVPMLAIADASLLIFAVFAIRVAKAIGLTCALPFFALGLAGHWLLWNDKRRQPGQPAQFAGEADLSGGAEAQTSAQNEESHAAFWLATVFAFPFIILSGFALAAFATRKPELFRWVGVCVFFGPVLWVMTVGGIICAIRAWMKWPRYRWPLPFYFAAIVTYWVVLKLMRRW